MQVVANAVMQLDIGGHLHACQANDVLQWLGQFIAPGEQIGLLGGGLAAQLQEVGDQAGAALTGSDNGGQLILACLVGCAHLHDLGIADHVGQHIAEVMHHAGHQRRHEALPVYRIQLRLQCFAFGNVQDIADADPPLAPVDTAGMAEQLEDAAMLVAAAYVDELHSAPIVRF